MGLAALTGRDKYRWAHVITCCDASPVFDPAEHTLDTVALFVAPLIVFDGRLADLRSGIQGRVPLSIRSSQNQSASYPLSASNQSASGRAFINAAAPV